MNAFWKRFAQATRKMQKASLGVATAEIQRALKQAGRAGAGSTPSFKAPPFTPPPSTPPPFAAPPFAPPPFAPSPFAPSPTTTRAPGGDSATAAGTFRDGRFDSAFGSRGYKLFLPPRPEGAAPLPLVVMLHGCKQDPDDFARGTRMNARAAALGMAVLYPAQAPRSNAQRCWNWFMPADQRRDGGEAALVAAMTREVVAAEGLDAARVCVAGLSAGGALAAILAREFADIYAAAAVHSGLRAGAARDVASALAAMRQGSPAPAGAAPYPVPMVVFHGDADGTVAPINGEQLVEAALGGARGRWLATHAHGAAGHAWSRVEWRDAAEPQAPPRVEHWRIHGAGHAWSGGDAAGSYADARGPDASAELLRFFVAHAPAGAVAAPEAM